MDLRMEIGYTAAPEDVLAMLADEDFLGKVAAATGALSHEASIERQGASVTTRLHRVMPPMVPDFVRKFVGDTLDVRETTAWGPPDADGSRNGTTAIEIAKAPVQLSGTTRLEADGTGSRQTLHCTIKAGVPFIGGKIEQAAADAVKAGARQQEKVAARWLAGSR